MEEQWDVAGLEKALAAELQLAAAARAVAEDGRDARRRGAARDASSRPHTQHYDAKVAQVEREALHQFERTVMLQSLDTHWREHLAALDHLRQGIHLRGYAQKNPKQEYKREAFELFSRCSIRCATKSRAS